MDNFRDKLSPDQIEFLEFWTKLGPDGSPSLYDRLDEEVRKPENAQKIDLHQQHRRIMVALVNMGFFDEQ